MKFVEFLTFIMLLCVYMCCTLVPLFVIDMHRAISIHEQSGYLIFMKLAGFIHASSCMYYVSSMFLLGWFSRDDFVFIAVVRYAARLFCVRFYRPF
jgi:hypothetical protein